MDCSHRRTPYLSSPHHQASNLSHRLEQTDPEDRTPHMEHRPLGSLSCHRARNLSVHRQPLTLFELPQLLRLCPIVHQTRQLYPHHLKTKKLARNSGLLSHIPPHPPAGHRHSQNLNIHKCPPVAPPGLLLLQVPPAKERARHTPHHTTILSGAAGLSLALSHHISRTPTLDSHGMCQTQTRLEIGSQDGLLSGG
jgi:hypothetical protein